MSSIPPPVAAILAKLPTLPFNQELSFEGFLKLMGMRFDETTNKYKLNLTLDTNLSADDELVLISVLMKRFTRCERGQIFERDLRESYLREKEEVLKAKRESVYREFKEKIAQLEEEKEQLGKEKIQLKKRMRKLQHKIQQREKLIAPKPISKSTAHQLIVVKLKEPNMYRLGRVQKRNARRRLTQIAEEEGVTYNNITHEETTKTFEALPHAIDSASSLRDFLKKENLIVKGRTQTIQWKGDPKKLYDLVALFNNLDKKNVLPEAARIFKNKRITDYFPTL